MMMQLGRIEHYQLNPYAFPYLAASLLMLFLGAYVFMHAGQTSQKWAFLNIGITFFLWLFGTFAVYSVTDANLARTYLHLTYAGGCFISLGLYYYAAVWLGRVEKSKRWILAGLLTGFLFFILIITTNKVVYKAEKFFWGYHSRLSPVGGGAFLLFFFAFLALFFLTLYRGYHEESDRLKKQQIRFVGISFLIATIGSSDLMPSYFGISIFPLGGLMMFGAVTALAYTIIRYKLLDIQTMIHKTIMWFCTTVVAVLPFAGFVHFTKGWVLQHYARAMTPYFLTIMVVFYFYFRAVKPKLDQVFRRRSANLQAVSTRFSAELAHLKNLRELLQGFVRMVRKTLYTGKISIYLKDTLVEQLNPAIAKRIHGLKPVYLDNPFLKWIEEKDEIIDGDLAKGDPGAEGFRPELAEYFEKTKADIVVPFVLGGKLVGVANLGSKENLKGYTVDEIEFLSKLKSSVAIAFANSLQFIAMQESLQKWNDELEKKVEERTAQLQETQAQLVQAEKLATIGTLAGGVAHEINNPLTAVLTNAQILKMSANKEDLEMISLIEEGAKRCQFITQKLMKYARKPLGREAVSKVDINKTIQNTTAFLNYQLSQENIQLVINKPQEACYVEADANELEQVITNLILNSKDAIKLTENEGKIEVEVKKDNQFILISIRDNGVGIIEENIKKIFDPFFTTKEIGKGTGLGLSVSLGIIQKYKGNINVNSLYGDGATFLVSLPAI